MASRQLSFTSLPIKPLGCDVWGSTNGKLTFLIAYDPLHSYYGSSCKDFREGPSPKTHHLGFEYKTFTEAQDACEEFFRNRRSN
jgi:hypothetical protein